jgi:hypothetical protein
MFDVFYSGKKPGLFAHEREADSIEHAQKLSGTRYFWWIHYLCDYSDWDWLFEPRPWQSEYTHVWPSAWPDFFGAYLVPRHAKTLQYYHHDKPIPAREYRENFTTLTDCEFDYGWVPHPWEPPYIYVFGNQHWDGTIMPTVAYTVPGAVEQKFMDWPVAQLPSTQTNWQVLEPIDENDWDWTWVPNPTDPPYVYVFGNQWNPPEHKASVKYVVPGASEIKYMDRRACRLPQPSQFKHNLAVVDFDYSWEPNPFDPPFQYVFGNQWNSAVLEPTVVYTVPGATKIKYVEDIVATVAQSPADFELLDEIQKFDYSWRPNPTDPPYVYVFGNQWLTPEQRPALQYRVGQATEIKYMDHPRAQRQGDPEKFQLHHDCDFDWSWEPDPGSPPYVYIFGNQWHASEIMPTVRYEMPLATELKYMDDPVAVLHQKHDSHWHTLVDCDCDHSWQPDPGDPPYIYVFGNQWHAAEVMPTVEYHVSGATERKYMDVPIAKLLVDMTLWHVPDGVDITDMDFSWVPDPGSPPYIYQFATQHQKTGGPQYHVPGSAEIKYVDMMKAEVVSTAVPIVEIDHLDGAAGQIPNTIKRIRYFDNYRDTLIRLAKSLVGEHEYVWVCSSICNYSNFDFSWHPERWQSTMLHVFASDNQKFGDTFYMHVPTFAERAEKKQLLEWYSVNYVPRRKVPRRPMPVIVHDADSQVDAVKTADWAGPLATFTNHDYVPGNLVTVPLWRQETKTIVPVGSGAGTVVVPKVAVPYIKTQLYDYAHIDRSQRQLKDPPLDIVFISNGESEAEFLFELLQNTVAHEPNRLVRVQNINGRVNSQHAAAQASLTPWYFVVWGKLEINSKFDWSWQPDRMQQPKHYIFHAHNPINGLVYGHQAMIAYNKKLVLENTGEGLDFTLDQPHEVVPIMSGTANYHTSNWMCWRTAFREVIKLRASLPDVESEYRLNKWLTVDTGAGQWSSKGAQDAMEYYDEVGGDFASLKKSYEWSWLATYAFMKHNLIGE